MKGIVWFRSDLRIDENTALKKACQESDEVDAIYLYSKNQHKRHNESNIKIEFLIQNLFSLETYLQPLNISYTVINSDGFEANHKLICNLSTERGAPKSGWTQQLSEEVSLRDQQAI